MVVCERYSAIAEYKVHCAPRTGEEVRATSGGKFGASEPWNAPLSDKKSFDVRRRDRGNTNDTLAHTKVTKVAVEVAAAASVIHCSPDCQLSTRQCLLSRYRRPAGYPFLPLIDARILTFYQHNGWHLGSTSSHEPVDGARTGRGVYQG